MLGSLNMYALPKYTVLNDLLYEYNVNIQFTDTVNIIIDLKQLYRKAFNSRFELEEPYSQEFVITECERLSSEVLSIISHYRKYFASKKKFTNFYVLYSKEECKELTKINPNYKKDYYDYYLNSPGTKCRIIKTIDKTLDMVCSKIPHVKKINTSDFDEFVYANFLCTNLPKNQLVVILSNDEHMYRLCSDNVICLNLKGNSTQLITVNNVFRQLDCTDDEELLSGKLLNIFLAIKGDEKYSLPGVSGYSYKKTYKALKDMVDKNLIRQADYLVFPLGRTMIPDARISSEYDKVVNNFNLMNRVEATEYNKNILTEKTTIPKRLIDMTFWEKMVERFFTMYEIDLEGLLEGEFKDEAQLEKLGLFSRRSSKKSR